MTDFEATGSCLCEGVKYKYTGRPKLMLACHCSMCRKVLGAPYGVFAMVDFSNFHVLKKETLGIYKSSANLERAFCSNCGGGIYDMVASSTVIFVNAGTINGDPGLPLQGHIFTDSKACWVKINDGLPASGEGELLMEQAKKLNIDLQF